MSTKVSGMPLPYPPGARLQARPESVEPCPTCADPLGRGYPTCLTCADRVDALWKADWDALAAGAEDERELAATVLAAPVGSHPWTCVDWAMRLLSCPVCRGELGTGPACLHCAKADQARWAWDHAAPAGAMTANEHAIRLAVAALRGAGERRDTVVAFWRLSLPHLLVGAVPSQAQVGRIRVHLIAGRFDDLAEAPGFAAMAALADLPWRSA
ncbi:hypothetical protein [Actinokineospora globicatena]|uniref:hypothetical protein n=1 Tax=Actinokineospora globicatena TaxID=103729 RepID=UPI0020A526EC|nr:hypothetical protein [Actinokineospora globicatena]MCP2300834.1 hypothetical protein [Actinokineospora globicatena]GLW77540.1 hypothetical protein Aglo01_20220 [Actinokineospora globicatena]GLW84374.1 hypothetical protein Aglo02_20140 [Actinokineospora globicatena]